MNAIDTRWSEPGDCPGLADLHCEAWRYAYAGIIPGLALERMIGRRGPRWWRRLHRLGARALVLDLDGTLSGYATLGPARARRSPAAGEIYELYLRPECHGAGLGRALFDEARRRLAAAGRPRLTVWALSENEIACRFYRGLGGRECGRACERIGGARLEKTGFAWP